MEDALANLSKSSENDVIYFTIIQPFIGVGIFVKPNLALTEKYRAKIVKNGHFCESESFLCVSRVASTNQYLRGELLCLLLILAYCQAKVIPASLACAKISKSEREIDVSTANKAKIGLV